MVVAVVVHHQRGRSVAVLETGSLRIDSNSELAVPAGLRIGCFAAAAAVVEVGQIDWRSAVVAEVVQRD